MLRSGPLLVAGLLAAGAGCYLPPAQVATPQGFRVRVTSCGGSHSCGTHTIQHEGPLVYLESDSLLMWSDRTDQLLSIAVPQIRKLEVYRGNRPSAEGAVKGGAAGAVVGTALGAATGVVAEAFFGGMFGAEPNIGEAAATGAAYGLVDGAMTGAAVGAMAGSPVWQEVSVLELRQELCHCRLAAEASSS